MTDSNNSTLRTVYDPSNVQPPIAVQIDIVAVHGLNPTGAKDHAFATWTSGGKMWLRDFLPAKLTTARVMVFDYNASVAFTTSMNGIREHATVLLSRLNDARKGVPDRPIIFLCHSLGGLVVKKALLVAATGPKYASIQRSTYGIMFFATPHRGGNSKLVGLGKFITTIVRHGSSGSGKNTLLKALEKNGYHNEELRKDWKEQLGYYAFVSFHEDRPTVVFGKDVGQIVDQESASFDLPSHHEEVLPLSGDHSAICRYSAETDANYTLVQPRIADLIQGALSAQESALRFAEAGRTDLATLTLYEISHRAPDIERGLPQINITDWLKAPNQDYKLAENRAFRTSELQTGTWFTNGNEFLNWRETRKSWMWLYGIPGCGKTVLNASIVQSLKSQTRGHRTRIVLYFYFDFNREYSTRDMIRWFIQQATDGQIMLHPKLRQLHSTCGRGKVLPEDVQLFDILQDMLEPFDDAFILIDALDECTDKTNLEYYIERMSAWESDRLHVLMTSRREAFILNCLAPKVRKDLQIDFGAQENSDIKLWLEDQLTNRPIGVKFDKWTRPFDTKKMILETLLARSTGMFLLARLQLAEVGGCRNEKELKDALDGFSSLNNTFARVLQGIKPVDRLAARKILTWLTFSRRPLYVEEIGDALAVTGEPSDRTMKLDLDCRLQNGRDEMFGICSSLIKIAQDPWTGRAQMQLAHLTVKEYLTSTNSSSEHESTRTWLGFLEPKTSHRWIARASLAYLLYFDKFQQDLIEELPYSRYAAEFWHEHARLSGGLSDSFDSDDALHIQMFCLLQPNGIAFVAWIRFFDPDKPEMGPELNKPLNKIRCPWYYASLLGLRNLVRPLLTSVATIDDTVGFEGTALQAAAARGCENTVSLLIELGADVGARASPAGHDALQVASYNGSINVVRQLIRKGADVNSSGGFWCHALQATSYRGHVDIVRLLIAHGADVNAIGKATSWGTALVAASWQGFDETVQVLIDEGAIIDLVTVRFGTALQAAAYDGRTTTVAKLIENGACLNIVTESKGTALQAAASRGWVAIVEMLLRAGAEVNAPPGKYGTAIQAAKRDEAWTTVELLKERGATE